MAASTPISAEVLEAAPVPIHPKLTSVRRAAVVPAFNEEETIAGVIAEIRAVDPGMEIIVVDDASFDRTPVIAAEAGARVLRLACNLGIGGAVQTGFQAARELECDIVVQIDGDGQHDPKELPLILGPVLDGRADIVIGSRFAGAGKYRAPPVRRLGMRIFASFVSLLVGKSLSDTSSSFRAINRRALSLFAVDYPHGYLETIEATVMAVRYGLRIEEVPVQMRERTSGRSSLTTSISLFYTIKVVIAVFISMFRRKAVQLEEER
jgi:glycosyltransferase involved in cell wall biosynthesis